MKRIKSVLKRFLLWIGAAALLWLMAGCRTSDENTTHPVWKGTEYWIDAAKAEGEAELPKVSARVNAPPRVEKVLTDESGRLTVTINADVEISDAAAAGIYKLEAADFSQETVTLLFQRLCEGRNMLEPPSGMTKRQVEAEIAAWRKRPDTPAERIWRMQKRVKIMMDDSGVFYFWWESPCYVRACIVEDTQLRPFDDVLQIFEKAMQIDLGDYIRNGKLEGGLDISISHIELSYIRIYDSDAFDSGIAIPAWVFFGMDCVRYGSGEEYDGTPRTIMAINAIDGSVIDVAQGY